MFSFFKKKDKPEKTEHKIELSLQEKDSITEELYEKLGLNYAKLEEVDSAIESLEKSLDYKLSIGDGYKKLMSLYNAKRAEAARNGDDAGIDKYMNKMDEMRQIAKKVTISG